MYLKYSYEGEGSSFYTYDISTFVYLQYDLYVLHLYEAFRFSEKDS